MLVIHFKRFKHIGGEEYDKLEDDVELANTVDLELMFNEEDKKNYRGQTKYDLNSIVQHYGTTLDGHYIADVKQTIEVTVDKEKGKVPKNQWFMFNDEIVQRTKVNAYSSTSYMLFFLRQT